MHCNGAIGYGPVANSANSIVVRARGTAGSESISLRVDGTGLRSLRTATRFAYDIDSDDTACLRLVTSRGTTITVAVVAVGTIVCPGALVALPVLLSVGQGLSAAEVALEVENHGWSDIVISLVRGTSVERLGMVGGLNTETFVFPYRKLGVGARIGAELGDEGGIIGTDAAGAAQLARNLVDGREQTVEIRSLLG